MCNGVLVSSEFKEKLEDVLCPYFSRKDLDDEGFATVVSYILKGMGEDHVVMRGRLTNAKETLEPHCWVVLEKRGYFVDRCGAGVFRENDHPEFRYWGEPYDGLLVNKVVFGVLSC